MFTDSSPGGLPVASSSPTSAYLHIPFCRRRCFYCDFPISVVGDSARGETSGTIKQYVQFLCQEILATPRGKPLTTVFLGGGTPSLLSVGQLATLLETLDQQFGLRSGAEISLEADPGTVTLAQLQGYRQAGVNRLSIGAQAFQPELLAVCGRSHTVPQIYEVVDLLQQASFENFSLDLISGLPGQTLNQWQASLEAAIALAPRHFSIYDLTVEPGTVFERRYQPGAAPLPTDVTTVEMYRWAVQKLRSKGYDHYEISNYAQPGYQCRHNRTYWENRPYYGFGMGATSYIQGHRVSRPRKRHDYYQWVQSWEKAEGAPQGPSTSVKDCLLETLMLGLRLSEGLELATLEQQFGEAIVAKIVRCLQPYRQQGWVAFESGDGPGGRVCLTDPEGFLFSNVVLVALWQTFDPDQG